MSLEDINERVITDLEALEVAHLATRCAWLWPEDNAQLLAALQACQGIGLNYIEDIDEIKHSTNASSDTARRMYTESLRKLADQALSKRNT